MADLNQLKAAIVEAIDIKGFYEAYLDNQQLSQDTSSGWSKRVRCPIHDDKNKPNFFVNLVSGGYKCHACGASGSLFDFWMVKNGYNPEDKQNMRPALAALSSLAGIDVSRWNVEAKPAADLPYRERPKEESFIPKHNKADANDSAEEPIDPKVVAKYHKLLSSAHWKYLVKKRGLKKKTIVEAQIGWNPEAPSKHSETGEWLFGRYTIPIPNRKGEYRNIRQYSNICDAAFKMVNYVVDKNKPTEKRYGQPPRLFGIDDVEKLNPDHIILVEGEFDRLLLKQYLIDAGLFCENGWVPVTGTHGGKDFEAEWISEFFGRHVYLCLDCDDVGKGDSLNIANKHFLRPMQAGKFKSLRIVTLPLAGTKDDKDVSDYFLKHEKGVDDYVRLCLDTPEVIAGGLDSDESTHEPEEVSDLVTAVKDRRYIDKRVRVPLTISGTTSKVYHAIRTFKVVRCKLMEEGDEECCSINAGEQDIPYGHQLFIEACMQRESKTLQSIAAMACQKDQKCKVKAVKKVVMEEYFAHQVVARWKSEEDAEGRMHNAQELVQTSVYILQPPENIDIEPQDYIATGWIRTHPVTSVATFFIEDMEALEEDWRKFTVESSENRELIRAVKEDFTTEQITEDIVNGVTRIYDADEILYAVLLTYLSPLWFEFNGDLIRGWLNVAIIGDSGSGKSKTYQRMSDWLELGDLFSCMSGTRTGLLYAIKQKAGEWHVSIGRYVQSSCKIIAIDETQESPSEEIKRMAIAMESGYLKVDQVASGGYHTTTRVILLMNPKDDKGKAATISDFAYGCDAIRMCFDPMFIRRLDLAVFVTGNRKYEFYNKQLTEQELAGRNVRLSRRLFKSLVYWAWTRKPENIVWTEEATSRCLELSTELSKIFGDVDQIPLVNPQDFRENLARLSTAYAILSRSFTEDLESVEIMPVHVNAMANYVNTIYSSSACNLKHKSKQAKSKNTLEDYEKIKAAFERAIESSKHSPNRVYQVSNHFCQMLLLLQQLGSVRKRDLAEQLGLSQNWVGRRIAVLQGFNMIEMSRNGYTVTRKFNLFMRRWQSEEDVEKMLDSVMEEIGKNALEDDMSEEWMGIVEGEGDDPFV